MSFGCSHFQEICPGSRYFNVFFLHFLFLFYRLVRLDFCTFLLNLDPIALKIFRFQKEAGDPRQIAREHLNQFPSLFFGNLKILS